MPITELAHDGKLDVATGRSRKETNWKNREMLWSEMLRRMETTHRTAETYREYLASSKPRQDEIKDIGGFVGGYLTGGRRKPENVMHRQLVTLDIDFAPVDAWDDFQLLYSCAAALYSTHKHSSESPRYRLIIPLSRPVLSDEYMAISRKVAGMIGIEYFDHTTFQPSRLMYWPSTAKDGEYVFCYQDGPWMDADNVLASYRDWRDSSEWPVSERYNNVIQHNIKKQGDPLEKPGIVGAFCRTYSISEVIETYLSDIYESCAIDDRYTYKEGSTASGLVVYEDKYAYSHHGTDPVSGKLCNAFDLVRLHKFGLKDEDAKEGTPVHKLPSFTAMLGFATKDANVRKQLGNEKLQDARIDFDMEDIPEGQSGDDWLAEMDVDAKGHYHATIKNIMIILNNDPNLKGKFVSDAFTRKDMVIKNLPWRKVTPDTRYFTDIDMMGLRDYLEKVYDISHNQKTCDAVGLVFYGCRYHPVKDYLGGLEWDGNQRLDTVLIDYLGAEDSPYVRAVTRKTLVAAVARIYRPGTKFDNVLTLVGMQGAGKSTLIKKLGKDWYCENLPTVQGKEAAEQLQGVWLMEMGELAGLKKAEVEVIKNFISRQEDSYRPAYATKKETYPRQCVFIGTTNNKDFLRDPTGNRRFWPVDIMHQDPVKDIHTELSSREIDQIWAEALFYYHDGEPLHLDRELEEMARIAQGEHAEKDDRVGMIEEYLNRLLPANWDAMGIYERRAYLQEDELQAKGERQRKQVCIAEIWCELLGGMQRDMNRNNTKELHIIMQNLGGWKMTKGIRKYGIYGYQRSYERTENLYKNDKHGTDFKNFLSEN